MKFTILTKPITLKEKLIYNFKLFIKNILNIKTYGPISVVNSIILGLKELGLKNFNINPNIKNINNIILVPNGIESLKSAIILKKKGIIKTIIAGPNISIPTDKNNIIFNKEIDKILVPSKWVQDYFLSLKPNEKRINIWASGISDNGISKKQTRKILIYKKKCSDELLNYIKNNLNKKNIKYSLIGYGNFDKNEYIRKLDDCIGIIYLQESESQGLALHEAWMKDIPTIVWNKGFWEYKGQKWTNKKISAPYLNEKCGIFFKGKKDFNKILEKFINNLNKYTPRNYSLQNFTNKQSTKKLLLIINK